MLKYKGNNLKYKVGEMRSLFRIMFIYTGTSLWLLMACNIMIFKIPDYFFVLIIPNSTLGSIDLAIKIRYFCRKQYFRYTPSAPS